MKVPSAACDSYALEGGVVALAAGIALMPATRTLLVADAHFAYEDVVGGALPLWSTSEIVATLLAVARRTEAREIVFLGDIVHGPRMSEGAARTVQTALDELRAQLRVTLVAGNHEGRARAFSVIGETVREARREDWLLVHGDGPAALGERTIIGHLHPSLRVGSRSSAPAFVAGERLIVLPALTPYSPGLDVLSDDFGAAIGLHAVERRDVHVVVAGLNCVYPFGSLARLRAALRAPAAFAPANRRAAMFARRRLRGDR